MKRRLYKFRDDSCEVIIAVNGEVFLRMNGEVRNIGFLFFEREELVRTRRQFHIFREMNAVGFSYALLKGLLKESESGAITLSLEGYGRYVLTREGFRSLPVRWFKPFERQVFISLSAFSRSEA